MTTLLWIVLFGLLMSAIAMVGGLTLVLKESTLERLLLPMVAFAAGTLIGGALFHMLPAAVGLMENDLALYVWFVAGFVAFLILEQVLMWHHCHRSPSHHKQPLTYLVLIADGLHNFIGGLSVSASFIVDLRLGLTAWFVAAAHEIPQELGDFGILIHGGWAKNRALLFNVLSGLTFLIGGLMAYGLSSRLNIDVLIPFAAGNFLYIGAVDLIPEFKNGCAKSIDLVHTFSFLAGLGLLLLVRVWA